MRKSEKYILLLVPLLVFAVTLRYNHVNGWSQVNILFELDQYVNYSAALVGGYGYTVCAPQYYAPCHDLNSPPSAYRLPGTPLLYAGIMMFSGLDDPFPSIRYFQALFSALTAMFVVDYARRLFGNRAGLVAGTLMIANPAPYYFAFWLLSENLFLLLMAVLLYVLTFKRNWVFLLGLCVGALLLTRGSFMLTVPFLLIFIPPRRWFAFGTGILILWLPWFVRNAIEMNAFIPFSTGGGAVLYGANNQTAYTVTPGHWLNPDQFPVWESARQLGEVAQDQLLTQEAIAFIRAQNLPTLLSVAIAKVNRLFLANANPYPLYPLLLQLGVIAFRRYRHPSAVCFPLHARRPLLIMAALWIGLLLNTVIFWGDDRFRLPLDMTIFIVTTMLMFGMNPNSRDWKGERMGTKSKSRTPVSV